MTSATQAAPQNGSSNLLRAILGNGAIVAGIILVALFIFYSILQPRALTTFAMNDLLNNSIPLALAAVGGTVVMLTRGFDLSVAGVISLVNVCMATMVGEGFGGAILGLLLAIFVGLAIGAINGFLVSVLNLQSIAATLSTMIMCSGLAIVVLDAPGGYVPDFISYNLTDIYFGFLPFAILIVALVAVVWLVIRKTEFGLALYAIGADETAASLAGVPVVRTKFMAYCLAGVFYGLAGFMLSAVTATGSPSAGTPFLLLMFAAIAMGGTSFAGGSGGPIGSIVGAATLVLLQKTLFSLGLASFYTFIFQGLVMIAAVLIGSISASFGSRMSR